MADTDRTVRRPGWGSVVTATAAVFGLLVSSGVLAAVVAGFLQWGKPVPPLLDNALPLLVLFVGMLLAGRVAVDVAGHRAPLSAVGAALVVAALGLTVSRSSEAHGDGIEVWQVVVTAVVVLVLVGGSALFVQGRREAGQRVG